MATTPFFWVKNKIKYQSSIPADNHGKQVVTGEVGSSDLLTETKYDAKTQTKQETINSVG